MINYSDSKSEGSEIWDNVNQMKSGKKVNMILEE